MEHSKEIKTPTKFEIRANIIKILYTLKNNCSSRNLNKAIVQLKKISDRKFLLTTLIKEISGRDKNYDNLFKIIIIDVFKEECKDELQRALLDEKNSDSKKFFLIDILRELDVRIDYNNLEHYIQNPEKLLDEESELFINDLIKSPSKQIDFLDFLYSSNKEDRETFVQYAIEHYSGDNLSNILCLASFVINDNKTLEHIINTLGKTKSYYAFEAFEYIESKNNDENILKLIEKTKNKLEFIGLDKKLTKKEISKELLSDTSFYEAKVSLFDSKGDFVLVFSRIDKSQNIDVFFIAFNLLFGILACFGFQNITPEDYKKTLSKVFGKSLSININANIARSFIDDAILNGEDDTPYEALSWRRLTYDIPIENNVNLLNFPKEFKNFQLNNTCYNAFLKKDYLEMWFIKENENPYFKNLLLDIKMLELVNQVNIKKIINKYIEEIFKYKECFRQTILLQGYFLYLAKKEEDAKIFYTIAHDIKYYDDFCTKILHKSIYEYFLNSSNKKYLTDDFLGIIEKWQREF